MLNNYETVFITIPDIPEDDLKKIKDKLEKSIKKDKGEIVKSDDWGVKKLAYEIEHNRKGKYISYNYNAEPQVVSELERNLKLDEKVLRFTTFKNDPEKVKVKKEAKEK